MIMSIKQRTIKLEQRLKLDDNKLVCEQALLGGRGKRGERESLQQCLSDLNSTLKIPDD